MSVIRGGRVDVAAPPHSPHSMPVQVHLRSKIDAAASPGDLTKRVLAATASAPGGQHRPTSARARSTPSPGARRHACGCVAVDVLGYFRFSGMLRIPYATSDGQSRSASRFRPAISNACGIRFAHSAPWRRILDEKDSNPLGAETAPAPSRATAQGATINKVAGLRFGDNKWPCLFLFRPRLGVLAPALRGSG